jgi:hypothetical protein
MRDYKVFEKMDKINFNVGDIVYSSYYHKSGEVVAINEDDAETYYTIAWNKCHDGLCSADEYDDFDLPIYDNRYYGTYRNVDIIKYGLRKKDKKHGRL